MSRVPPFLHHLGLDGNADERAIRRAYAQRLKTIDPEKDPDAFQLLHESFESAKQWARLQSRANQAANIPQQTEVSATPPQETVVPVSGAVPESTGNDDESNKPVAPREVLPEAPKVESTEVPPAIPESAPSKPRFVYPSRVPQQPKLSMQADPFEIDQDKLSEAVFSEFVTNFARLTLRAENCDEETVSQEILRCLNDPRLVNLLARERFEQGICQMLVNGWRRGHEVLFAAAANAFRWMDDSQRLAAFGNVGEIMNRALTEYATFLNAPPNAIKYRRYLIGRLRDSNPPEQQEIEKSLKSIETLFARHPTWMRMVTCVNNIAIWREGAVEHGKDVEKSQIARAAARKKEGIVGLFVVIAVIAGMVFIANKAGERDTFVRHAESYAVTNLPGKEVEYTEAQYSEAFDRIKSNVHIPRSNDQFVPNFIGGTYSVEIGPDGRVIDVEVTRTSTSRVFDYLVLKAVRESQPYPRKFNQNAPAHFSFYAAPDRS